ncbi:MAG TPA: DUF2298 domain-containing protein [Anaerolineaceae bacterium]|nr:DUF2298 domain-containing protein [Anaerolineaceae bacterium]
MISALTWYLSLLLVAIINLPLTFKLFSKLPSRGFALARPLGLLIWAFPFWLLASVGLLRNDLAGQATVLIGLFVINVWIVRRSFAEIKTWIVENSRLVVASEALFLVCFILWSLVRSMNPDILYTEKFMEMAFINGILRSPSFPPLDPWLSGFAISYYYFGYVMSAMLIRLSGVSAAIGYNLVSGSWFALTAAAVFGVGVDLIAVWKSKGKPELRVRSWMIKAALVLPLMLLIVSNWHGVFDVMHERGLFNQAQSVFWSALDLRELENPSTSLSWIPERNWQWWAASRTVKDFRLSGDGMEVIDEFPFFTYLLADIHPHLLGMPFVLTAIAQALNALLGGWEGETGLLGLKVPIKTSTLLFVPVLLGGIAFMNTWDFPFYLLLICIAYSYWRYALFGIKGRLIELVWLGLGFGIASVLFYLPFYLSFASQAGGVLPSLVFFTRGKYFWIMFGPLLTPILFFLFHRVWVKKSGLQLGWSLLGVLVFNFVLFAGSWGLGWLINRRLNAPELVNGLYGQPARNVFVDAMLIRLRDPWTWLTLFVITCLALLLTKRNSVGQSLVEDGKATSNPAVVFVSLLILLGVLLTLAPEFVFLRDQFTSRMNTIFKFYFQAWIVWSLAAGFGLVYLLDPEKRRGWLDKVLPWLIVFTGLLSYPLNRQHGKVFGDVLLLVLLGLFVGWLISALIRRHWRYTLAVLCLLAIAGGLVYPVIALPSKLGHTQFNRITLDGFKTIRDGNLDQAWAIEWLQSAPTGVMAEAVAATGGSYTTFNLISTFSGMPSLLGWIGHEAQWRGGYTEIGNRQADLETLYSTKDWIRASEVIRQYGIRYIYVGGLERQTYQLDETKFADNLKLAFESGDVRIYEVTNP